jgi:hypothetical protein
VTVCLPPWAVRDVDKALTEVMAPFDNNLHPQDDGAEFQGEWDWWHIYGRDGERGGLPVRAGHEDDPRIIFRQVLPNGEVRPPRLPSRCDGGPRGILDFEADRHVYQEAASVRWNLWQEVSSGYPPAEPFAAFRSRTASDPSGYPAERAEREYRNQPVVQAVINDPHLAEKFKSCGDLVGHFTESEGEYVRRAASRVIPTNVLLTLDGRWIDGLRMVASTRSHPRMQDYWRYANEYLDALEADVIVVRLRFHD